MESVSTPITCFVQGSTVSGFTGQLQKERCFIERNIVKNVARHKR